MPEVSFTERYNKDEGKPYKLYGTVHNMGRTHSRVNCPHCPENFKAFHWSLAGGGKKCPGCGAIHFWSSGMAYPVRETAS